MSCYSDLDKFKIPESIFTIEKYPYENSFSIKWCDDNVKLKNYRIICEDTFPTLYDAINEVKLLLQKINKEYFKHNGRRVVEGVVINGVNEKSGQMYLKIKPKDIELEIEQLNSVQRRFILKEVQKYFDEFGSTVARLYEKDDKHYIKYVKYQLKEEFTYEQIEDPKTQKRIKSVFMEVWDSKIPPIGIQNICEDLIGENPDESISELMKIFARTYPSKKDKSRYVYAILEKRMNM